MTSLWSVPIAELLRQAGSKRDVEASGELRDIFVSASRVPDGVTSSVAGTFEGLDSESIRFRGHVSSVWDGECRRCLGPASGVVEVDLQELFERVPESEDIYPLSGDRLDLEPLVRDAIYLELPQAPLCKEDCQGLCPECGADRNTVDCGHAVDEMDPRWAALRELRPEN